MAHRFVVRGSWNCVCGSHGAHTHTKSNYDADRRFKFGCPHQLTDDDEKRLSYSSPPMRVHPSESDAESEFLPSFVKSRKLFPESPL